MIRLIAGVTDPGRERAMTRQALVARCRIGKSMSITPRFVLILLAGAAAGARYVEDEVASASAITHLPDGMQYIVVVVAVGSGSTTATPELIALALP